MGIELAVRGLIGERSVRIDPNARTGDLGHLLDPLRFKPIVLAEACS